MTTETDHARQQAEAQLEHIRQLMEWLEHANECQDYDACIWSNQQVAEYDAGKFGAHDPEQAQQAIHEHPLSVEVRGGWRMLNAPEGETPSEFRILLCTGKPAVRIIGELNEYGEPESARIEYQDWNTPWTEYSNALSISWSDGRYHYGIDKAKPQNHLLRYSQQFYFGS